MPKAARRPAAGLRPETRVYLDHAAGAPAAPEVLAVMREAASAGLGNPASLHRAGVEAAKAVERSRAAVAAAVGADPDEIVFTSGGTEANNLALKGAAFAAGGAGGHLVVSSVEHRSVLEAASWLKGRGFTVSLAPVDRQGRVDLARAASLIGPRTVLVSVMHANNETGVLQPVAELSLLCRKAGALFHTDACQSFGKEPLDLRGMGLDLVSLSARKIHGPAGVGALVVRRGVRLEPLLSGGGHERGLRSGTPNCEGIAGFGKAAELADPARSRRLLLLAGRFLGAVRRSLDGISLLGGEARRLPNILGLSVPGVNGKDLMLELSRRGVFISTGSACSASKPAPSHVLLAMGLGPEAAAETVRVSLGWSTTAAEIDLAARIFVETAVRLRGKRGRP